MSQLFINKVREIVLRNLEDEDFSVKKLSTEVNLSRSQLLRRVKASTGKSVNKLINDIRLEEAAKLLIKGKYSTSEIAYRVGYKTPSYFFKCFHDHYGYTPGEYKALSEKELLDSMNSGNLRTGSKLNKKIRVSAVIISIIVIGIVVNININNRKYATNIPSLAVLPFKNFNNEIKTQYLADGLWDDLLSHLSSLEGLDVRSRQSLERYRGSIKSMSEIGKELEVNFIIECSVQKIEDEIKVIIQLIEAANDRHIWSDEYNFENKDIFITQCEIAKQIAGQLNVVLTDEEEKSLEIFPTDNVDAFKLYMQAKSKANIRTKENLTLAIKLLEQAIVLDANFADAYAEMAQFYFLLGALSFTGSNLDKVNELNNKALKIDSNTVRVYTLRAMLNLGKGNWELAEKDFKKAIALKPNDPTAHHYFALYYGRKPIFNAEEILNEAKQAYRLDPLSNPINNVILNAYLQNNKVEEAQEHFNKINTILPDFVRIEFEGRIKSHREKDYSVLIDGILEAIEENPNDPWLHYVLGKYYNEIYNDDINYLKHCQKAFELEQRNPFTREFFRSLLENREFEKAYEILSTDSIMKTFIPNDKYIMFSNYNYHKGEYKKALEYIDSSNYWGKSMNKLCIFAQMRQLDSINQILDNEQVRYQDKAITYAILEERDSMYFYLDKMTSIYRAHHLNKNNEFDLYRNETRYKSHLKKHYLPIAFN